MEYDPKQLELLVQKESFPLERAVASFVEEAEKYSKQSTVRSPGCPSEGVSQIRLLSLGNASNANLLIKYTPFNTPK